MRVFTKILVAAAFLAATAAGVQAQGEDEGGEVPIAGAQEDAATSAVVLSTDADRVAWVSALLEQGSVTPLVAAARAKGCRTQVGLDMLFEMIPAYLEFFGFPPATAEELRAGARLGE